MLLYAGDQFRSILVTAVCLHVSSCFDSPTGLSSSSSSKDQRACLYSIVNTITHANVLLYCLIRSISIHQCKYWSHNWNYVHVHTTWWPTVQWIVACMHALHVHHITWSHIKYNAGCHVNRDLKYVNIKSPSKLFLSDQAIIIIMELEFMLDLGYFFQFDWQYILK